MSEEKKETIIEDNAPENVSTESALMDQEDKETNPEETKAPDNNESGEIPVEEKEENVQKEIKEEKKPEFVEEIIKIEDIQEETEYPPEEFEFLSQLYNKTLSKVNEGDIVSGKILDVSEKEVIVDIGFKSEGIMPLDEFDNADDIKPGDTIEVYLEKIEDMSGQLILSKR